MPTPLRTRSQRIVFASLFGASLLAVGVTSASADEGPRYAPAPPPQPAPGQPGGPPSQAVPGQPAPPTQVAPLTAQQLDELVAPVALYPDVVLYSMLPAATAPSDLVAAARHAATAGGKVDGPPEGVTWDPNVVAMLQYPDVLAWMNENAAWVEQVGFAMTTQQPDVLAAIQRYRAKAKATGVLDSNEYQKVIVQNPVPSQPETVVIVIQPTSPQYVYVPSYDPYPVLDPYWTYAPSRPFYSGWFGYSFSTGPWAWNEIAWGYPGYYGAFYTHSDPYWWYGRRSPGYYGGSYGRPYLWRARYRDDWTWSRHGWQPRHTVRPTNSTATTAFTRGTTGSRSSVVMRPSNSVRPSGRVSISSQTTPSPVLRPDPSGRFRSDGRATVTTTPRNGVGSPGTGVTVTPRVNVPRAGVTTAPNITTTPRSNGGVNNGWSRRTWPRIETGPRIETTPRVTPRIGTQGTLPRFNTPRVQTTPQLQAPQIQTTPRVRSPIQIDRSRIDGWSRRGRTSLDGNAGVTVTPRAQPKSVAPQNTNRPEHRVAPTAPRGNDRRRDRDR
jgi:hypothetical protein